MKKFLAALMTLSTVVVQSGGIANAEVYDRIAACKAAACRYCAELNAGDDFYEDDNERASLLPDDCRGLVNPDDSLYGQRKACNSLRQICETSKKSFLSTWKQLQAAAAGMIVTIGITLFYHGMNAAFGRAGNVNGAGNANPAAPVVQQAALTMEHVEQWMLTNLGATTRKRRWAIGRVRAWLATQTATPEYSFINADQEAFRQYLITRTRIWSSAGNLI